jgi:hypothetical protein
MFDLGRFWNNGVLLDIQSVLSELALKVTPLYSPLSLRGDEAELP